MLRLEAIVQGRQRFTFSTLTRIPCSLPLVANTFEGEFATPTILPLEANTDEYTNWFTTQGGIFSDEMGLGKTISLIALFLSNPRTNKAGEFLITPSIPEEVSIDFVSRATLVVCPSQLVAQWTKEIRTHSSLTVCSVATHAQHRKLTHRMVVHSDVVVVSEKFLFSNTSYQALVRSRTGQSLYRNDIKQVPELDHTQPVFELIHWHRIVIDEAHEILSKHDMDNYHATYRWYVTGTPLPRGGESLDEALNFLKFKSGTYAEHIWGMVTSATMLHRTIYRRNTKSSVDTQITIPPVLEKTEFVTLTPIEQVLYDAATFDNNDDALRQIISDPTARQTIRLNDPQLPYRQIANCKTQLASCMRDLKTQHLDLAREQRRLDELEDPDNARGIRRNITLCEKRIERSENNITRLICKSACFSRLVLGDDLTEVCDACGGLTSLRTELAECHHYLCAECVTLSQTEGLICPQCKTSFDITKVVTHTSTLKPLKEGEIPPFLATSDDEDPWYASLRLSYGTKFAATARYLLETMQAELDVKMIVFSQYDAALQKIARILEDVDPDTFANRIIVCKGNVHARKRQLEGFNSTDPDSARILLLSLKNAASGTHLPAATHVLLLDPVVGDAGAAQATDAQAVARAHRLGQDKPVSAVRFIVPRTIDQKDYEKAYGMLMRPGLGPKSARSAHRI